MSEPELAHYSQTQLGPLRSVQPMTTVRIDKPAGFWVSVEDGEGWFDWSSRENMSWIEEWHFRYRVILKPDAAILWVRTVEELDALTEQYGADFSWGHPPFWQERPRFETYGIRWDKIAKLYQGIFIAPYRWERRLDNKAAWYYGWDCSSGCIWDVSAIESVEEADRGHGILSAAM